MARSDAKKQRKRFTRFLAVFRKEVELNATKLTKESAKQIVEDARDAVENQSIDWVSLKPEYLERKEKEGLDPRILIATREYLMTFGWGVTHGKVWCGIPSDVIHEGSGLPAHILGRIHEFGTATIPPRPLWRTVLSNWLRKRKDFARVYRNAAVKAAQQELK